MSEHRTFVVLCECASMQHDPVPPESLVMVTHKPFLMPGEPSKIIGITQAPLDVPCTEEDTPLLLADKQFHLRRQAGIGNDPNFHLAIYEWGAPRVPSDILMGENILWEGRLRQAWSRFKGELDDLTMADREDIDIEEE